MSIGVTYQHGGFGKKFEFRRLVDGRKNGTPSQWAPLELIMVSPEWSI